MINAQNAVIRKPARYRHTYRNPAVGLYRLSAAYKRQITGITACRAAALDRLRLKPRILREHLGIGGYADIGVFVLENLLCVFAVTACTACGIAVCGRFIGNACFAVHRLGGYIAIAAFGIVAGVIITVIIQIRIGKLLNRNVKHAVVAVQIEEVHVIRNRFAQALDLHVKNIAMNIPANIIGTEDNAAVKRHTLVVIHVEITVGMLIGESPRPQVGSSRKRYLNAFRGNIFTHRNTPRGIIGEVLQRHILRWPAYSRINRSR